MSRETRRSIISGLVQDLEETPVQATPTGHALISRRFDAMTESSKAAGKETLYISPDECTIWPGNARDYAAITLGTAQDLIDSILAENGNKVPVVIRRNPAGEGRKRYELLVGTRRHWAVAWLNANAYPDIKLLAVVEQIDDEAAFRLADLENRARNDISAVERGRNYRTAIDLYYGGVASRMAERLNISRGYLSELLAIATIPDEVVAAFPAPTALTVNNSRPLIAELSQNADAIKNRSTALAAEQQRRREKNLPPIDAAEVLRQLLGKRENSIKPERVISTPDGRTFGRVLKDTKKELVVQIDPRDVEDIATILQALDPVIRQACARNAGRR